MSELLFSLVSELKGTPPDVPFAPGVDVDGLKADDPDPMFLTLPIVKVGGVSGNGFTWERPDVENVVREINAKKPEGIEGHVTLAERSSKYVLPKVRWLGAALIGDTAYAKGYIPRTAAETREYLRVAKRSGARVGTSVYGLRGKRGLSDMSLESIDFGHPDRLGLPDAAAVPHLTSEMQTNTQPIEEPIMPNDGELKLVSELTSAKDNALRQVSEMITKLGEKDQQISELQKRDKLFGDIEQLIAEIDGETAPAKVKKLVAELAETRKLARQAVVKEWVEKAIEAVELEELRPTIIAQMGEVDSLKMAEKRVAELMERPDIKLIAEALLTRVAGPKAFVGGKGKDRYDLSELNKPESIQEARNRFGI